MGPARPQGPRDPRMPELSILLGRFFHSLRVLLPGVLLRLRSWGPHLRMLGKPKPQGKKDGSRALTARRW